MDRANLHNNEKQTRVKGLNKPLRQAGGATTIAGQKTAKGDKDSAILQEHLGYFFKDTGLLQRALTHRSFGPDHNERLEFLGDSVLGLCISDLLHQRLLEQAEGDLSRIRANLVRQETLHQIALQLGLPPLLRLGPGESKAGGAKRPSILADGVEALLGAVYLDSGFTAAHQVVSRLYANIAFTPDMAEIGKDAKTVLQEILQGQRKSLPVYEVVDIRGQAHVQIFEVECRLTAHNIAVRGVAHSKRAAEQEAAKQALEMLDSLPPTK